MLVTLEEVKENLRVDFDDEDDLITTLINTSEELCKSILRKRNVENTKNKDTLKTAIKYGVSYLFEHREEANFNELNLTLRSLLFADRKSVF